MDIYSEFPDFKPRERIIKKLVLLGVPNELPDNFEQGLVALVKKGKLCIPDMVSAILPTHEEIVETAPIRFLFRESMVWLQWLMFEGDPKISLNFLAESSVGERGVCGAIWGSGDIAYRCRTCEHDPTCAICVPCFQNGNHKNHDYSIIHTGGGCCDCGDITAWKLEGFCSKHKGTEQIQPLPEKFANSVGPVIEALFQYWKNNLFDEEAMYEENSEELDHESGLRETANEMTLVIVEMLLEFCKQSESLLSFVSGKVFSSVGLLDILVRAEKFLDEGVTKKLHELLLKLLGEPVFKYEFAKVFLKYYPNVVGEAVKARADVFRKYPLLSTFSVQIFTVPTLTLRLVKEMNLLGILLGCLEYIFFSCAGEDGHLQVNKWGNLYETTIRVVEDTRFVMSHVEVTKYATHDQRDISRTWMRLLAFAQGMDPIKRARGLHEDENENIHLPFLLGHSIADIQFHLTDVVLSGSNPNDPYKQDSDHVDGYRHAKVGKLSLEKNVCSLPKSNVLLPCASKVTEVTSDSCHFSVPSSATWLTYQCLRAIENWLRVDNISASKKTFSKIKKKQRSSKEVNERHRTPHHSSLHTGVDLESVQPIGQGGITAALDECMMDKERVESKGLDLLSLSDWPDIEYDVSSQDVSVHIPMHRFLSQILLKSMRLCFGESTIQNVDGCCSFNSTPTIYCDFLGHMLAGFHPYGFSAFVMEHPLRIRVFCAQVHAGMWRRNGDTAYLLSEWYRLRWPDQGFELDLFLLQCCAALAPADLYVTRILERFGLSNYLSLNLQRSNEFEPALLQEMLTLIIQIVTERRFCGLTTAECLKRELIFKLAIGDATHSRVVKSLPRDLSKSDQLHEILDNIAEYSHPSGTKQGMFSLRQKFWKELNLYHPRWNPRDLQLAEERYLRFCKASALTAQLPRWTKIFHPLSGVARVATCKSALQIMRAVFFYAVITDESIPSRAPHGVLLTALHLLSLALDICSLQIDDSISMLDFASEDIGGEVSNMWGEQSMVSLLVILMRMHKKKDVGSFMEAEKCDISSFISGILKKFAEIDSGCMIILQHLAPEVVSGSPHSSTSKDTQIFGQASDREKRRVKAREKQAAIMAKMKAEQSKFLASIDSTADDGLNGSKSGQKVEPESEDSTQDICSLCHDHNPKNPVSFLILLQKSRLMSFVDKSPPSWEEACLLSKKEVHIPTNTAIDQFGSNTHASTFEMIPSQSGQLVENTSNYLACDGQPSEVNAFLKFISTRFPSVWSTGQPCTPSDCSDSIAYSYKTLEEDVFSAIWRELLINTYDLKLVKDGTKKVNAEEGFGNQDAKFSFLGNCTTEIPKTPSESPEYPRSYDGYGPTDCDGIHLSSCGHAVHRECLERYLLSLKERYNRRIIFEGGHIVDPDQGQFLCPVCRRLANSTLPALPREYQKLKKLERISDLIASHATSHKDTLNQEISFLGVQKALSLLQSAANVVGKSEVLQVLHEQKAKTTKQHIEPDINVLFRMYFPEKRDMLTRSENVGQPSVLSDTLRLSDASVMWDTLRYSLISTEIAARSGRTSMTPNYNLDSLYKELGEPGGFILSLLYKIVQSIRHKDPTQVLLRFGGIQLFTASICSGTSLGNLKWSTNGGGNMLTITEHVEGDVSHPDIQFLKRVSGPILARDPFSSFMWLLFCLPYPFMSCEESFLTLLHIFYIVSVAQAIITYFAKFQSAIGFHDCMISDISKHMESIPSHHFNSNYIDPNCDMNSVIRSLSFPFLRRCMLLSKLASDFTSAPFCDSAQVLKLSSYDIDDMMDFTCIDKVHLSEVENLENMFKIPPIDVVLKDEMSRSLVIKWLRHLCSDFKTQSLQSVLYSTPAVPFKLMHLPNEYQDILQRCIKQCCPDCKAILVEPALCLLCGRLCSPSWKLCCSESGCETHAMACGAGTGVFMLIKRTSILLQRSARQALWTSLYLDAFGEEDIDMLRGKPLYLNKERHAALSFLVASHGLDRSSEVLRQTAVGLPLLM